MVNVSATSSLLTFAALAAAASSVDAVAFTLPGINYNIRAGEDWAAAEDKCKSSATIASELEILKSYTGTLRLYSLTDCDIWTALVPMAIEAGFQLELGLWVDSYETSYPAEKEAFEALLETGVVTTENIVAIHVGSEAIYRGDVNATTAVTYMNEIRDLCTENGAADGIPFTITDVGNTYLAYPDLIDEVDFVSANLFPFWDSVVPAKSAAYFLTTYQRLVDLAAKYDGDKAVVIGETGWATNGTDSSASETSPENQAVYFHDFYLQAQEQEIMYYWFSSFDEAWKGTDTVEAYFGLFTSDGEMKPDIAALVLDDEDSASASISASASASASDAASDMDSSSASATAESVETAASTDEDVETATSQAADEEESETETAESSVDGAHMIEALSVEDAAAKASSAADETSESTTATKTGVTHVTDCAM